MQNRIVYIDLDGVLFDWNKAALDLIGVKTEGGIFYKLASGGLTVQKIYNLKRAGKRFDLIRNAGSDFWANLEPLPWAQRLLDLVWGLTNNWAYCTSHGGWDDAPKGKIQALRKMKWKPERIIITREKHFLAHPNAFLIDDYKEKCNNFYNWGGKSFLFPCQFKLQSDPQILENVFENLERSLKNFLR